MFSIDFRCHVQGDDTENLGPGRDRPDIGKNVVASKQKTAQESQWQGKRTIKCNRLLITRWNRVGNGDGDRDNELKCHSNTPKWSVCTGKPWERDSAYELKIELNFKTIKTEVCHLWQWRNDKIQLQKMPKPQPRNSVSIVDQQKFEEMHCERDSKTKINQNLFASKCIIQKNKNSLRSPCDGI